MLRQGDGGAINLQAQDGDLRIASDGSMSTDTQLLGKLKLVTFADERALKKAGSSLYDAGGQAATWAATASRSRPPVTKALVQSQRGSRAGLSPRRRHHRISAGVLCIDSLFTWFALRSMPSVLVQAKRLAAAPFWLALVCAANFLALRWDLWPSHGPNALAFERPASVPAELATGRLLPRLPACGRRSSSRSSESQRPRRSVRAAPSASRRPESPPVRAHRGSSATAPGSGFSKRASATARSSGSSSSSRSRPTTSAAAVSSIWEPSSASTRRTSWASSRAL